MNRNYIVSIVIPTYKTWDLTNNLSRQLEEHERFNIDHMVLVNDDPGQPAPIHTWRLGEARATVFETVLMHYNVGFTLASNAGIKESIRDSGFRHIIFLISNDVQIHGKFIQQAADILLSGRKHLVGNRLIDWDTGWNEFDGRVFNYLEGFFLAATSDGWQDLGGFDEQYAPHDFEDVDLSTTAKSKGYKLVSLNNPNIVHKGAGTLGYNPEREAITIRNKELFRQKWLK